MSTPRSTRSRITNGSHHFAYGSPADLDSAWARRWRDLIAITSDALGGDSNLTEHKRVLIKQYASLCVALEQFNEAMFTPDAPFDHDTYLRTCGALNRSARQLGLSKINDDDDADDSNFDVDRELARMRARRDEA